MIIKLAIDNLHFHDLRHEAISRLFELGTLDIMEVSAISGHKSLSMLKRYTHLKAQRLVKKLEGNRHKGKQVVLNHMIPYPAEIILKGQQCAVRVLDFENMVGLGLSQESAILAAQDALLRRIMTSIRDAISIPPPNQYLEVIDEQKVIMIDPLAGLCA